MCDSVVDSRPCRAGTPLRDSKVREPIKILYEDNELVVCIKRAGLLSEAGAQNSLPDILASQLSEQGGTVQLFAVHRLDREAGGVMVYAKTAACAAHLSRQMTEGGFGKRYMAVLCGVPEAREATLEDLLFHDRQKNKTYVVKRQRRGVKSARLDYRVLDEKAGRSLIDVKLYTGRTHQIRVQFASRRLPLLGDAKYGGDKQTAVALWSYELSFVHPSGEAMSFADLPYRESAFESFWDKIQNFE